MIVPTQRIHCLPKNNNKLKYKNTADLAENHKQTSKPKKQKFKCTSHSDRQHKLTRDREPLLKDDRKRKRNAKRERKNSQ
jgi:hypothetical protein